MKIAIVHEMLIKLWGAEKVVENWMQNYPDADIFTLIYNEKRVGKIFPKEKIHPQVFSLRTQKIYNLTKKQRFCLPFMVKSIEQFDLSAYDVVLVSSSGFAHGITTESHTKTIIYYHSPARYMWDWTNEYKRDIHAQKWIKWCILNYLLLKLRQWDYEASQKHTTILANSKNTAKRIQKYYRKEAAVLYPPIETKRFEENISKKENMLQNIPWWEYYIILSALTEFKKIGIPIRWFKEMSDINLMVIWDGDYRKELETLAWNSKNISFVWAQFWDNLVSLVQSSHGLIFPGEEDFGIVPIEVMAAGKPVFALRKWWLTETVIEWKTWSFFEDETGSDFVTKFIQFDTENQKWKYSSKNCISQASKFDKKFFEEQIRKQIKK